MTQPYKKKLIEVAIPLEAINAASAREKSIRHGHPSTLHLWWARRPLATCRAVLFAQLVDDPSSHPDKFPTEQAVEAERKRLFGIIEELVKWENSTNEEVLKRANDEIMRSCGGTLPSVYDPFSGGGSIPLEAQRLGLPAYGSDLNPVAVMIGKAMIEIPPKFKDMLPIHPGEKERGFGEYKNAEGLAEDVSYYGAWMRKQASKKIGHLYPNVELPKKLGGGSATVVAWIWARTVPSPDPAFSDVPVPLISNFVLSSKKGQETRLVPIVDRSTKLLRFEVSKVGTEQEWKEAKTGTKSGAGSNFRCLFSNSAITPEYIRQEAGLGRMGQMLIAIVAKGSAGRVFVEATPNHSDIALSCEPSWVPEQKLSPDRRAFTPPDFGMETFGDLFTKRQLVALDTYSSILSEVRDKITADLVDHDRAGYADAVCVYLGLAVSKLSDIQNSLVSWKPSMVQVIHLFTRQAIPIVWDFAEPNLFSNSAGDFGVTLSNMMRALNSLGSGNPGSVIQSDAQTAILPKDAVISTDPPYYDNIGYSDLSDFFLTWLRRSLREQYPELFSTLSAPKTDELIAAPYRHGGRENAEEFFLSGMRKAVLNVCHQSSDEFPATIFYAFKQSEVALEGVSSTGWATFLQAVFEAGFSVVGTWPVRTELANRIRGIGSNALANSVVLVCRKKVATADTITRAEFLRTLKNELPPAITELQAANVSPADMPQSAIGPGMGVFSRYAAVLEADDTPMSVKTALQLINAQLDEFLNDLHGDLDPDTRFAATWFEQHGLGKGEYGAADNLARARGISVESVKHAGIIESSAGKVRILKRDELDPDWDPETDDHLTVWEACQYLIRALENDGEYAAAELLKKLGGDKAEMVKDLAYYLYDVCANKRQDAKEATAYNGLIAVWPELTRQAATITLTDKNRQARMDL